MRHLSKTLLLAASLCAAPMALAGRFDADDQRRFVVAQQDGPSLSEAVEMVRRQYNGRIVSAETQVNGNREIHVIKVLTEDGKVKTVRIPGRTRGA
ncbi:MAG: PepSY domain-containing protein [Woeseiaceae bacterium]